MNPICFSDTTYKYIKTFLCTASRNNETYRVKFPPLPDLCVAFRPEMKTASDENIEGRINYTENRKE